MKPTTSSYADVNGIKLYHEIYGEGEPLVLIHGGLTTIGEMQGWIQSLGEDTSGDRGGDAGPRPHGGHRPADEFRHHGRRHRRAARPSQHSQRPTWSAIRSAAPVRSGAAIQHPEKVRRPGGDLVALMPDRLVSRGAEGHEPGRAPRWPKT